MSDSATLSRNEVSPVAYSWNGREVRAFNYASSVWFVAVDIARELEYSQPANFIKLLDEDERLVVRIATIGGRQNVTAVSVAGVLRSIKQRLLTQRHNDPLCGLISVFESLILGIAQVRA